MSAPPLELIHLNERLHRDFDGKVPLIQRQNATETERNFFSRALAAFAIHELADCTLDEAAASVVDGGGEFGLDAIYLHAPSSTLWLIQSKYDSTGNGQADLSGVTKFCDGVNALLSKNFDAFRDNAAIITRKTQLSQQLDLPGLAVRAALVYSGLQVLAQDRLHVFDRLLATWCHQDDFLKVSSHNLTSIHDWITGANETAGVENIDFCIRDAGWVRGPLEAIYGRISVRDLAELWQTHKSKLVSANLRSYKGSTEVNEGIHKTLTEEPLNFFYLNNGLTAYCERFVVRNEDRRADARDKRVTAHRVSIVNGAQTLGSIGELNDASVESEAGFVMLRLISLHGCDDERAFAVRITQTTNFQNQVTPRDFVALDSVQQQIADGLAPSGVNYHYKVGQDTPPSDTSNFTLDEVTTALACLDPQSNCEILSRIVAQKAALWSYEPVYPAHEPHRSRCERLFKTPRSACSIWRAVQAQRFVLDALQSTETGVRKDFFVNGRWLVLRIVYLRLKPQDGNGITLTTEEGNSIASLAVDVAERLWGVCEQKGFVTLVSTGPVTTWSAGKHMKSVFSSPADCELLKNALLASINRQVSAPLPSST